MVALLGQRKGFVIRHTRRNNVFLCMFTIIPPESSSFFDFKSSLNLFFFYYYYSSCQNVTFFFLHALPPSSIDKKKGNYLCFLLLQSSESFSNRIGWIFPTGLPFLAACQLCRKPFASTCSFFLDYQMSSIRFCVFLPSSIRDANTFQTKKKEEKKYLRRTRREHNRQ